MNSLNKWLPKKSLSALSAIILCFLPTILSLQCIYLTASGPGDVNLKLDELSLIMPGGEPFALYFVGIFAYILTQKNINAR